MLHLILQRFISDTCCLLNINAPSISYDTSNFSTDTMMAQCNSLGTVIYLRKYDKPNPDQFFAIAHELRHVWQIINDEQLYFSDYKPIDLLGSVEKYNSQIAEIDANAFAGLIMEGFFHIKPLFESLPDFVKAQIYERMDYLMATEFFQ